MDQWAADLRSGIRVLLKYPTLSLVAVLTLGVGIGLSTTVFSIVNGAAFKGLPFRDADRIVAVVAARSTQNQQRLPMSVPDLAVYEQRQTSFDEMGAYGFAALNVSTEEGRPERLRGAELTAGAFRTLGVQPVLGRGFRDGDDRPGATPVILLGYDVWRERFRGSPDVIGATIRTNGTVRTIVGVMPETFRFPFRESAWIPLVLDRLAPRSAEGRSYGVVARLKSGVRITEARAQMASIASQLDAQYPDTNRGLTATVMPFTEIALGPELYALLYTMLGAGLGVLLIACVNVSNLLAARASLRQREVAVRIALGAGRVRIVRQHLTEVVVLALLGAVLGVLLGMAGVRWFSHEVSANPPPFWMTFGLDSHVMLFVAGLIMLASLVAGAAPALYAAGVNATATLKDESRGATGTRLGRFSTGLVIAELTISCGLLIAAGLMIKSVVQLRNVSMPFAVDNILTARIDLPRSSYPDSAASIRFYEQLLPRLQAEAGIQSATLSDGLPAAGNGTVPVQIEGKAYAQVSDSPLAREGIVTAGYFATFQTPILGGREFLPADTARSQPVAIINESFARTHFPGVDALGRRFKRSRPGSHEPWLRIVGVVPDLIMQGIGNNNASPVGYYIPISQSDVANGVRIAVRTSGDPAAATSLIRSAVASLDSDLAIYEVETLRSVIDRQSWFYHVFGTLFTVFGVCALLMAAAGLYGVMSFSVTQRTREMGVRSALGAPGAQLVRLVMRRSVIHLAVGLALGLVLALLASGALEPVLYHVDPRDRLVFATVVATLALVSLAASFLPARRVTRIDPVIALAAE